MPLFKSYKRFQSVNRAASSAVDRVGEGSAGSRPVRDAHAPRRDFINGIQELIWALR